MKKLLIFCLLAMLMPANANAIDWDKLESRAYSVLEISYIGAVGIDMGATLAANRRGVREGNRISRAFLEGGEGLFIVGGITYGSGVTFGMRKFRKSMDAGKLKNEKWLRRASKLASWVLLAVPIGIHSMGAARNLSFMD